MRSTSSLRAVRNTTGTLEKAIVLDFARLLQSASLTTDLQTPRLCLQAGVERQVPEKYRILGQLAGQGLGAGEIAQALSISRAEASQLLSLTSVADRGRPALAPCRTATGRPISA